MPAIPGLSDGQKAAWVDLTASLNALEGIPDAIGTSFNRAHGAFDAGAPEFWQDLQMEAFNEYTELGATYVANIEDDAAVLGFGNATPLPATLPLFATGLGALGLLARRKKRKNTTTV